MVSSIIDSSTSIDPYVDSFLTFYNIIALSS